MSSRDERRRKAEPRPVTESLGEVSTELGLPAPGVLAALLNQWSEIVGTSIAVHARPRSIRGRLLTVAVDAPAWATELRYQEARLVERIADMLGAGEVVGVRVVVERPEGQR